MISIKLNRKNPGGLKGFSKRLEALAGKEVAVGFPRGGSGLGNPHYKNGASILLVAVAFGKENYMHYMAKLELERVPIVGPVLQKCGICFVDRGKADIDVIRNMMRYLKHGEKVFMFPEGTRVEHDNEVEAKTGAVRIASKMKVPIVPVYIPRGKKIFGRVELRIGKPYTVEGKTHEEYEKLADGIMERIYELRDGTNG